MSGDRFSLDTNILVYAVDRQAGQRHLRASSIIEAAATADCWLTLQSISEFYAAASRKRVASVAEVQAQAQDWLELFRTMPASADAVRAALGIAAAGRASYWDALLVATAAEGGCTAILTEDLAGGSVLFGVRVINPFVGDAMPAVVETLLAQP